MRGPFAFLVVAVLATVCSWATTFSTTYKVGDSNKWEMSNFWNKGTFYIVPATGQTESVALFPGIFEGKVITSDVVVTLHVAIWSDGMKPKADTFSLFADSECKKNSICHPKRHAAHFQHVCGPCLHGQQGRRDLHK